MKYYPPPFGTNIALCNVWKDCVILLCWGSCTLNHLTTWVLCMIVRWQRNVRSNWDCLPNQLEICQHGYHFFFNVLLFPKNGILIFFLTLFSTVSISMCCMPSLFKEIFRLLLEPPAVLLLLVNWAEFILLITLELAAFDVFVVFDPLVVFDPVVALEPHAPPEDEGTTEMFLILLLLSDGIDGKSTDDEDEEELSGKLGWGMSSILMLTSLRSLFISSSGPRNNRAWIDLPSRSQNHSYT